jgi:hypothetical protein
MPKHAELSDLVDVLLEFAAAITQIVDHMARAPGADPGVAVETLRQLLPDVLASLEDSFPREDLRAATAVLNRATDAVLSEILLVPHGSDHSNGSRQHVQNMLTCGKHDHDPSPQRSRRSPPVA